MFLMPEISIIVPVYKVEQYLHRCVRSILNQSFSDFELILVDDGSPDNCGAICDSYAAEDHRVRVIHKNNSGVSAARNAGLDIAVGKYIMFCDSDDYVAENWCETMYQAAEQYPDALIVHNGWTEEPCGENRHFIDPDILSDYAPTEITYYECFRKGLSGAVWNKIFDKRIIQARHLRFDEKRQLGEDVIFHTEYMRFVSSIIYIQHPLYYYIINPYGAVHKYYPDLIAHHLAFFSARYPLIEDSEKAAFCDTYFYYFIHMLDNTMDPKNTMTFWQKMRYNHKMMNTEEFRTCVDHISGKNDSPLFIKVVKTYNYYFYWLFQKILSMKS